MRTAAATGAGAGAGTHPLPATVAAAAACAVAALPVTAGYAPGRLPLLLVAAAVAGTAVTAALRSRLASTAALALSLLVLAGAMVAVGGWLPRPDGSLLAATATALRTSGAHILTTSVPVPVTLATVALPVCGTWLAAAGCVLVLASPRPSLAALPPVTLFAGALALVGPTLAPAYPYTIGLAVALAVLLAMVEHRRLTRLPGPALAGLTALVAAATALAGPVLAGDRSPPDLRAQLAPPYVNPAELDPLSLLAGWAADPDQPLLEVRTATPCPLRWVVLTEFNGVTWRPASRYRSAGALLPVATPVTSPMRRTVPAHHEIASAGLSTGWLPAPAGARQVTGVPVAIDPASSTLVAPGGLGPATSYTVDSQVAVQWHADRLAEARLPTGPEFDAARRLARAPERLHEIARLGAGTGTPYQRASRLAGYLRETYRFDPEAPGGNGYPSITRFLDTRAEQGGRGTSEQFATAFAVLARSLGMPSRVVVGFEAGDPAGGDRYLIRSGHARAWAEIYFEGAGWVPFDPTPAPAGDAGSGEAGPAPLPVFPPEVVPPSAATPSVPPTLPDRAGDESSSDSAAAGTGGGHARDRWVGWLALPAGVLLAGLLVIGLRLRLSTTRLGRGGPADRVLGGWAELRDALRLAGRRPATALTVAEVADLAAAVAGDTAAPAEVRLIASAVNRAGFGGGASPAIEADAVATGVRAYRRAIRRAARWPRRMTWWLDPRPLWWRW